VADPDKNPGNANVPSDALKNDNDAKEPIQQNAVPRSVSENGVYGVPGPVWHSRGYRPHFESSETTEHVTFHLEDSLPQTVLLQLEAELKTLPAGKQDVERRERVDAGIDAGHGSCGLRQPGIADMVQGSLLTFDSQRYRLLAWVVMPNHVHVLFQPINGWTVAKIVASWKKFAGRKICDPRRDSGEEPGAPIWHRAYWDRYICDQIHLLPVIKYIHRNPVKAGLLATAESWHWSSAYPGNANLPLGGSKEAEDAKNAIQENGVPSGKP
jgi:REP element-mobilizing transposase RayT